MPVENLALALSSSMTAGINLYLTVLGLGLMQRFEIVALPDGLEWLSNPGVMVVAGVLFVVEFFADKFPVVDSVWDAIHTFIRVPAGGFLAAGTVDGAMAEPLVWMAGLGGSAVSLVSHGNQSIHPGGSQYLSRTVQQRNRKHAGGSFRRLRPLADRRPSHSRNRGCCCDARMLRGSTRCPLPFLAEGTPQNRRLDPTAPRRHWIGGSRSVIERSTVIDRSHHSDHRGVASWCMSWRAGKDWS